MFKSGQNWAITQRSTFQKEKENPWNKIASSYILADIAEGNVKSIRSIFSSLSENKVVRKGGNRC